MTRGQQQTGPNTNQTRHKGWKLNCTRNLLIIPLQWVVQQVLVTEKQSLSLRYVIGVFFYLPTSTSLHSVLSARIYLSPVKNWTPTFVWIAKIPETFSQLKTMTFVSVVSKEQWSKSTITRPFKFKCGWLVPPHYYLKLFLLYTF